MTVFEMIEAQQKGKENTGAWMVGEQLKAAMVTLLEKLMADIAG